MGNHSYDQKSRSTRTAVYASASAAETFGKSTNADFLPKKNLLRECRDSSIHPNALPVIIGLDVTGSMGKIPHELIKTGLPTMMATLETYGIKDGAVLFLAIGDHECDQYPLQICQFESGDQQLDDNLTKLYLEGNGGENAGESYHLAWYAAHKNTVSDAFQKRGQKGVLFTIGDEPCLKTLPKEFLRRYCGDDSGVNHTSDALLELARIKYDVYHIHVNHTSNAKRCESEWMQRFGANCIIVDDYKTIPTVIAQTIAAAAPALLVESDDTIIAAAIAEAEKEKS